MKNLGFKRIVALLLCACMLIPALPAGVFAAQTVPEYGDADGNGKIELDDLLAIERYVAGLSDSIDIAKADVNVDGVVDGTDSEMLRQYLVGNIELPVELCTITFDTDGGDAVAPIKVGKGYAWKGTIASPAREVGYFSGWVKPDGETYFQNEPITEDITLKAVYGSTPSSQTLSIDSFALLNQKRDLEFRVLSEKYLTAEEVKAHVNLAVKDGSSPVEIEVKGSDGQYTVSAKGGFNAGCSYELCLDEGIDFDGKESMIRKAAFVIERDEVDELKYNDNLKFIKDTDTMVYSVGGKTLDVLEAGFLSNNASSDDITGSFVMEEGSFAVGDFVCIYENEDPRERDYTESAYEDDALAYVQITAVNGNTYTFRSLSEDDADKILLMPTTIPFFVGTLPAADSTATVAKNGYDHSMWAKLGNTVAPEYDEGDILVFYSVDSALLDETTSCVYARVIDVSADEITYLVFPDGYGKKEIEDYISQEFFVTTEIDGKEVVDSLNEEEKNEILSSIAEQAYKGGFVNESMNILLSNALETDEVLDRLRESGLTEEEIAELKGEDLVFEGNKVLTAGGAGGGRVTLVVEGFSVVPTFAYGDRYKGGIGVVLDIGVQLSVDKKMSPTKTISLKLDLSASFEQQIAVGLDVGVDMDVDWYLFIPDVHEFTVKTSFDIKSYTSVSVSVKIYTIQDTISKTKWTALTNATASPGVQATLRKLNRLGVLAKKAKGMIDTVNEYKEQIQGLLDTLPKIKVNGQEYSVEELQKELGMSDVASEFDGVLSAEDETGNKVGIEQIMDKYNEMLNTECDWVELFNKVLFEKEFQIKFVAIKLSVNFVVTANVNIAIGADLEYEMGKRYNFWIDLCNSTSGSTDMDLLDERFGFQFYVMGTIGIKAGIRLEAAIGIISTKIGSVGASVEVGPYLKLYGYFFYIYTKLRPMNTQVWNVKEEMQGALYIEFGIYLTVRFKAQAFENTFKYETTLYNTTFPLLTAGVRQNVYDFATYPEKDDILYIDDSDGSTSTGITMALPSTYLRMKTMDLMTGERVQQNYPFEKFAVRFTDSRFSIDRNGVISVSDVGDERYIACEMSIVWKCDKLAFSKYDIDITVPVVWTLMSETERSEKFTASVAVGSANDGYTVVWSDRYTRLDKYDLPALDEVLGFIKYDGYDLNGFNLKYDEVLGYQTDKTTGLQLVGDTTYYFDVSIREYTATVSGVLNSDGTQTEKVYKARYGEPFDFGNLSETGANDTLNNIYSVFSGLAMASDPDTEVADSLTADLSFYSRYGTDAKLTAKYIDDSRTATFEFKGINAPTVQKQFRRGTVPDMGWISEYVTANGGSGASVSGITPEAAQTDNSITYVVSCVVVLSGKSYKIHFVSDIPLGYNSISYQEGSAIFSPANPTAEGYTFDGWYSDMDTTVPFDFSVKMPGRDITAYAKWSKKRSNITLISQGSILKVVGIEYDTVIDSLSDPDKQDDVAFVGWFTEPTDGTQVSNGDTYMSTENLVLFAHWTNKKAVSLDSGISYSKLQSAIYDEDSQTFVIKDNLAADGNKFIIWYKNEKAGYDWTTVKPVNAGTYEVAVSRVTDDEYLKFDRTVLPGAKLTVGKANLSLSGGNLFTKGGILSIAKPNGIKGNGKTTYSISRQGGGYNASHTSPLFTNVPYGTYNCTVSVAEGDNYRAATYKIGSIYVAGITEMKYDVYVRIKTGNNINAGTDKSVYAKVMGTDGSALPDVQLDKDGNDFYWGDNDEYFLYTVKAPWFVGGIVIGCDDSDSLQMDEVAVRIKEKNGSREYVKMVNYESSPVWVGVSNYLDLFSIGDFVRRVVAAGNFGNGVTDSADLSNTGSRYSYSYDGIITDDKYGTYDARLYYAPPIMTVTSGNTAYDNFIKFTGVTSFEIDEEGLAHYIAMNGGSNFNYVITLHNDSEESRGTSRFSMTRTVNVIVPDDLPYSLNPEKNQLQELTDPAYSAPKTLASDGTALQTTDLSELRINAKSGDVIEIPVRASADNVWGILAETKYDNSALELIGWAVGNAVAEENLTVQKDLSAGTFKVLATNAEVKDMKLDGTLVVLKFKVKDTAQTQNYGVTCESVRALNADGEAVTVGTGNSVIDVEGTTIPDTADTFNPTIWIGLAAVSIAVLLAVKNGNRKARRA